MRTAREESEDEDPTDMQITIYGTWEDPSPTEYDSDMHTDGIPSNILIHDYTAHQSMHVLEEPVEYAEAIAQAREARDLIRQRRNIPDDEEDDAIKFVERNTFEEAVTINTVMTLWEGHGTSEEEVLKDHKKQVD